MMPISVCIPTLNRSDLLRQLIISLQQSEVKPDHIFVVDNGGKWILDERVNFLDDYGIEHHYWRPPQGNIGVSASWNWFIRNTPERRVISNDDICFRPDSLGKLMDGYREDAIVCPENIVGGNAFSCFTIPNFLIERVGYFDEELSPKYA